MQLLEVSSPDFNESRAWRFDLNDTSRHRDDVPADAVAVGEDYLISAGRRRPRDECCRDAEEECPAQEDRGR